MPNSDTSSSTISMESCAISYMRLAMARPWAASMSRNERRNLSGMTPPLRPLGGVDVAKREAELGGDDAAIAAARAPAGMVGFEHDRRQPALRDVMRGRQPRIAGADDDDIGLHLAGKLRKGRQRLRRIRPERGGRCHWGPDLCHVSRPARLSFRSRRRRTPSWWRNENRVL